MDENNIISVFSEKQYMPHVYQVYRKFSDRINTDIVIRLLGGDRKEIEKQTGLRWNTIVEEKQEKVMIMEVAIAHAAAGHKVTSNVNNHYEGSAPLTIQSLKKAFNQIEESSGCG